MKKRNLLFAIILLMMTACENKQQTSDVVIIHPEKFVETEMKLTDIAEELEYIQLDDTRLMRSWQIKMTDKYIFVAARDELLQFDRKGTFIKTIGSKGSRPEPSAMIRMERLRMIWTEYCRSNFIVPISLVQKVI